MLKAFSQTLLFGATFCALLPGLAFASSAGGAALPEKPTEPVSFDYRGDAENGKTLSVTCGACHGQDGNSMVSAFPKLAGQHARYTYKQLQDMRTPENGGEALRPVPEMTGIVAGLSDQDMADLAAYYETLEGSVEGADPELIALGEKIYRAGNAQSNVPACTACHQPDGAGLGLAGYPQLAGQHPDYTAAQLMAFRAAAREDINAKYRVNDGATMQMQLSAKGMTDKEILAVSAYISGLMPAKAASKDTE